MKYKAVLLFSVFLSLFLVAQPEVFAQNETESSDFSYPLKLYNQAFYDLAARQFIKYYTNYPGSARSDQAHYYAAMSFYNLKEYEKARMEFQTLAIGFPKSDKAAEAWLMTGRSNEYLNDLEGAAKAYETIRLLYPSDPLAPKGVFYAATIYLKQKKYNQAFQTFQIIVNRYSTSSFYTKARLKSAVCLFYQQEPEKALQVIKKVSLAQADPNTLAEADFYAAKIYMQLAYFSQARTKLEHLIRSFPQSDFFKDAVFLQAKLYLANNETQKARKLLQSYTAEKGFGKAHVLLGDIYYFQNKYAEAVSEYKQYPDSSEALKTKLKMAVCQRHLSKTDDALHTLQTALEQDKEKTSQLHTACDSLYLSWLEESGRYDEAIALLTNARAFALSGSNPISTTIRLGRLLAKKKRWLDVIHELQPLTLRSQSFKQRDYVLFLLAQAYEQTGQYRESLFYYNKLIKELSASRYYDEAINRLDALQSFKIIDTEQAVSQFAQIVAALVNDGDKSALKVKTGQIFLNELKNFTLAEQQFNAALEDPNAAKGDIYLLLGKTYLAESRQNAQNTGLASALLSKAMEAFKRAVQNDSLCSAPDEAAWLLFKNTPDADSLTLNKQKTILEGFIRTYPQSSYLEEWYQTLAFSLAFDTTYTKESITYFKKLIQLYPHSVHYADYLYGFAQFLNTIHPEQAVPYYKQIASEFPYAHCAAEALYQVALDYEHKGQFKEAHILYSKLIKQYDYAPISVEARKQLPLVLVRSGHYQQAIAVIRPLLDTPFLSDAVLSREFLEPSEYDRLYLLARAYEGLDQPQNALTYYQSYLKLSVQGAFRDESIFKLGVLYFDLGQLETAKQKFLSVSDSNPKVYRQARTYLAELYFKQKNYSKAATLYKELIPLTRDDADKAAAMSEQYVVSLIRSGQIAASKKAIKQHNTQFAGDKISSARFSVELADYYRKNKKYDQAVRILKSVKKKYGKSNYADDADYELALIHISLNRIKEAFNILTKFYNNYPYSDRLSAALNTLGNLYFRSEKYDNAIVMFKNALKVKHDADLGQNITSNLIKTYTLTGFWDAAQALARDYVKNYPEASDVLDKKIIIAQAYINLNQFQNAVEYLKKIKLEADADREPEIQFYIGEALLKGGQYENAIAEFVKIPLLSKKTKLQWEASALYYSGQSYEKLGRTEDAIRMYKEIIRRPGIDLILKKEAKKRIKQIQ